MSPSATEWQERLQRQFADLKAQRAKGLAVFALEHGLNVAERADLATTVSRSCASSSTRPLHWLPLVVHATEVAYQYEGDEYWPSFARLTPGIEPTAGVRYEVRDAFRRFGDTYGGPKPQGRWADWFTLISWPISNAVLPTDLQRHLARALSDAGIGLADRLEDPVALGRYVASRSWGGSDRFTQLLEQPALLGQIALALLRPDSISGRLLLPATLQRIAADLLSESQNAYWLRRAREAASRPAIKVSAGPRTTHRDEPPIEAALESRARLIRPEVFLRRERRADMWVPFLDLPNLSPLAEIAPIVRKALSESRCKVPAASVPVPRGQLLYAGQEVRLDRWPRPAEALIRFEGIAAGLETALLRAWGPPTMPSVFHVRSNGTARLVLSRVVRPGERYVVAHFDAPESLRNLATQSSVPGVYLREITIPAEVDDRTSRLLRSWGCLPTRSSRLWLSGTVPVHWDGETELAWLEGDAAILGFGCDHDLRELSLSIGEAETIRLGPLKAGSSRLVEIGARPAGKHDLVIHETANDGLVSARTVHLTVQPLASNDLAPIPIRAWMEPYTTDLGRLWNGTSVLGVAGPVDRVVVEISLATRRTEAPTSTFVFEVPVPLSDSKWRELLGAQVDGDDSLGDAFDTSRWAQLVVDAGMNGRQVIEFERRLSAVRWATRFGSAAYRITLIDDVEDPPSPAVEFSSFLHPDVLTRVEFEPRREVVADPAGGLYFAERQADHAALIVPPARRVFGLRDLGYEPEIKPLKRDLVSIASRLEIAARWASAGLPGHLIARRWSAMATELLLGEAIAALCGARWASAERHASDLTHQVEFDEMLRSPSPTVQAAVTRIRQIARGTVAENPQVWLAEFRNLMSAGQIAGGSAWALLRDQHGDNVKDWAAEWYLRLAMDPRVAMWAGPSLSHGLQLAVAWVVPLRLGRYVAVSTLGRTPRAALSASPFDGWA